MSISANLREFKKRRVLVLGDVVLDEYIFGSCDRLSPEAPVPVLQVNRTSSVLGGAANTAANIASLGAYVSLIGITGRDEAGRIFAEKSKESKIRFSGIHDGRPTIRKTRILGQKQQLLRIDYESISPISKQSEVEIIKIFKTRLISSDIVILSDYAKGFFTHSLCDKILSLSKSAGKAVIVDPKPEHGRFYRNCEFITPNWKEAQALAGVPRQHANLDHVMFIARKLKRTYNCGILLTLGPDGIFYLDKHSSEHFHLPTVSRDVFDVSGAGDTVVAVFSLGLASGLSGKESVYCANRAAGVVVGKIGTSTVLPQELSEEPSSLNLIPRSGLRALSESLKAQGKKVVTLNGSFDLLHSGHLHIIKTARAQGDTLIVGLNSDASIKKYKGKDRPIIPEKQRAEMLLALEAVDFVHIFNETTPHRFIENVRPHIHVNGSEYGSNCIEAETVKKYGGDVFIVEKVPGLSTSGILKKAAAHSQS